MESNVSQRQILINRAMTLKMSQRIKKGIEQINQKQDKLSQSRCSSRSKKSAYQRMHRSVDLTAVTPKAKLLKQIADKLKSPKVIPVAPINNVPFQSSKASVQSVKQTPSPQKKEKKGRLEMLLKDIKKCNQLSTKAVSTVKKNVQNEMWTSAMAPPQKSSTAYPSTRLNKSEAFQLQSSQSGNKLSGMFKELISMKQQLRMVKQENKLLAALVQQKESASKQQNQPCLLCGCTCSRSNTAMKKTLYFQHQNE